MLGLCWMGIALLGVLLPARAHAWGDEGHQVTGLVAQHYLSPGAAARVQQLLSQDQSHLVPDTSLASETLWADRYRDSDRNGTRERYEATQRWHYVDLEWGHPDLRRACEGARALPSGVAASAGPARDCVVDKIEQFERELAAPATMPPERLLALQFLLHLVGDVHQPLHAIDDHDAGGTRRRVSAGNWPPESLHRYWDVEFVQAQGSDPQALAAQLVSRISAAQLNRWRAGGPAQWAFESYELAAQDAYASLPASCRGRECPLSADYVMRAEADVALQLQRAGVRLAWLLNRALR